MGGRFILIFDRCEGHQLKVSRLTAPPVRYLEHWRPQVMTQPPDRRHIDFQAGHPLHSSLWRSSGLFRIDLIQSKQFSYVLPEIKLCLHRQSPGPPHSFPEAWVSD